MSRAESSVFSLPLKTGIGNDMKRCLDRLR